MPSLDLQLGIGFRGDLIARFINDHMPGIEEQPGASLRSEGRMGCIPFLGHDSRLVLLNNFHTHGLIPFWDESAQVP